MEDKSLASPSDPAPLDVGAPMRPILICGVEESIGENVKQMGRKHQRDEDLIIPSEEDSLTHWVCSLDGSCVSRPPAATTFIA
jgi:hypothetical protein